MPALVTAVGERLRFRAQRASVRADALDFSERLRRSAAVPAEPDGRQTTVNKLSRERTQGGPTVQAMPQNWGN
jgi:hypothetical protein